MSTPCRILDWCGATIDLAKIVAVTKVRQISDTNSYTFYVYLASSDTDAKWNATYSNILTATEARESLIRSWREYHNYRDGIRAKAIEILNEESPDAVRQETSENPIDSLELEK